MANGNVIFRDSNKYCKECVKHIKEGHSGGSAGRLDATATIPAATSGASGIRQATSKNDGQPQYAQQHPQSRPSTTFMMATSQRVSRALEVCGKCAKPLYIKTDKIVIFEGMPCHAHHFTCQLCRQELDHNGGQWEDGMYCQACLDKVSNVVCAACGISIAGRSVTAMGSQFHPEVI